VENLENLEKQLTLKKIRETQKFIFFPLLRETQGIYFSRLRLKLTGII